LARLAAADASIGAMIAGQIEDAEATGPYAHVNRRALYATLHWCTTGYHQIAETVRELLGVGPFMMPADVSALADPELRTTFEHYWAAGDAGAVDRLKLMKLAWDYLGSELAGRHTHYERFYAGAQHVQVQYNFNYCPWAERRQAVDDLMMRMTVPAG
jgi:4-hydroxyphenylacetate 3-monooxygenase